MTDTILVTGAGGFIGRRIVEILRESGETVLPVAHRWSSTVELRGRLGDIGISRCIHLGWYAAADDYLTNVDANLASLHNTLELAELLRERGCRHLVVAGSAAEYGPSSTPLRETDTVEPWSVYGAAKASACLLLRSSLAPGLAMAWGRIFNVTGPGEDARRIVPAVARAAISHSHIGLTDGLQVRDYLDVRDVARALVHISAVGFDGVANISSGRAITLRQVLVAVADSLGDTDVLGWGERPRPASEPPHVVGVDTVLRSLGWAPAFDLDRLVAGVSAYWRRELSGGSRVTL